MVPPHQTFMCDTKKISNCMGIRLGIDYITWRNIHKWILPTSNLHVRHRKFFLFYGYKVRN